MFMQSAEQLSAELYDRAVPDWGGEIDIYREFACKAKGTSCYFPFEMKHLLARTGFDEPIVYGDFFKHPLSENSSDMIWAARK